MWRFQEPDEVLAFLRRSIYHTVARFLDQRDLSLAESDQQIAPCRNDFAP